MKLEKISLTVAAALALGLASCSKQEPTPSSDTGSKAADSAAADLSKTVEAAKAAGEKAVTDVSKQVQDTTVAASAKAQGLIDKAKSLIAEGKFSDAASVLQQLAGQTLSGDQTKLVESLKEQIQKALAAKATSDGASGVGNLLKK